MKKIIVIAIILLAVYTQTTMAQSKGSSYKTALGVKFYPGGAITLKHFTKKNAALEGLAYFWGNGFRITGLYEFHGNISGAKGLQWYVGPGVHAGFWNSRYWNRRYPNYKNEAIFGIDGVLGLDYKFNGVPINLSLDWQPSFEFGDYGGFNGNWGGLAIRYTF